MNEVNQAIYTRLQSGTALTALLSGTTAIYSMQAPENAALPFVIYNQQAGGEDNQTQGRMKSLIYQVRAVAYSETQAGSIDAAIDARLHAGSLTVTGWSNNFWTSRETDINFVENEPSGKMIFHSGALYRIRISKTG